MCKIFGSAMLMVFVASGLGCGGVGKGDLSGSVKYKGKTVRIGTVTVFGSDGVPRSALIDRHTGTFHVSDFAAGEVKVIVASPNPKEDLVVSRSPDPKKVLAVQPVDPQAVNVWFQIPSRYSDIGKTDLVFTLPRGTTQKDLELND